MYIVNIIHCAMISQLCGDTIMWKKNNYTTMYKEA